jgi:quinol monooxygenase YgiN
MLHARLSLITLDSHALPQFLTYIDREVRPVMEKQPGSLGLSLLARPEAGTAVLESFWASHDALQVSEQASMQLRGDLERRAQVPVTVARYQVRVFEREQPVLPGQAARLTQIQVKPSAVPDVAEVFGDSAVPWLAETPGFCGALLLADPASGHLISQTVWRDQQAREASPSTAAVIRADLLDSAQCVIRAVEDYGVVFSSARNA